LLDEDCVRQESAEEDEAIVNILLAMQQKSGSGHPHSEWHGEQALDGYDTPDDNVDESNNLSKWGTRDDEIGDILASQRLVEKHFASQEAESPEEKGWWGIAERDSRPTASPLSELGSPRVVLHTPQKRPH